MSKTVKKSKYLRAGSPLKPANMAEQASREWERISSEIARAGIELTPAHRAPLELAATIAADIVESRAVITKQGAYVESKTGLVAHPAVKRLDALRRDYIKVLTMLGVRQAVAEPDTSREQSLEDLLNG